MIPPFSFAIPCRKIIKIECYNPRKFHFHKLSSLLVLPCTGIVSVCPLFAVTVAVAIVTRVCPGTGEGVDSEVECGDACAGLPSSDGLSESKRRRRAVPAIGELYRSNKVGEEEETSKRIKYSDYTSCKNKV